MLNALWKGKLDLESTEGLLYNLEAPSVNFQHPRKKLGVTLWFLLTWGSRGQRVEDLLVLLTAQPSPRLRESSCINEMRWRVKTGHFIFSSSFFSPKGMYSNTLTEQQCQATIWVFKQWKGEKSDPTHYPSQGDLQKIRAASLALSWPGNEPPRGLGIPSSEDITQLGLSCTLLLVFRRS